MCYSYQSSLSGWLIAFVLSIYMLANGNIYNKWVPIMILTITQIQIMEAIIWATDSYVINSNATKLISYLLLLQPLVNSYMGYKYTDNKLLLLLFVLVLIVFLYNAISSRYDKFYSTIGANNHLNWNRIDYSTGEKKNIIGNFLIQIIYVLGAIVPIFFLDKKNRAVLLIFISISLFYSYYYYNKTSEFGTIWCYLAVYASVISLIVPYINI